MDKPSMSPKAHTTGQAGAAHATANIALDGVDIVDTTVNPQGVSSGTSTSDNGQIVAVASVGDGAIGAGNPVEVVDVDALTAADGAPEADIAAPPAVMHDSKQATTFDEFLTELLTVPSAGHGRANTAGAVLKRRTALIAAIKRLDEMGWERSSGGYKVPIGALLHANYMFTYQSSR